MNNDTIDHMFDDIEFILKEIIEIKERLIDLEKE